MHLENINNVHISQEGEFSKLLGMAIGLKLEVEDVDNILLTKLRRKSNIRSQGIMNGRRLVANQVLASTLWFFVIV